MRAMLMKLEMNQTKGECMRTHNLWMQLCWAQMLGINAEKVGRKQMDDESNCGAHAWNQLTTKPQIKWIYDLR